MKRLAALLAVSALAAAPASDHPFESAWDEWTAIVNARVAKTGAMGYDAREPIAWARVKSEFDRLKKDMDAFYRGQR